MITDSLAGIPLPQDINTKTKKKDDAEQIKPVEETGEGEKPMLDLDREAPREIVVSKEEMREDSPVGEIYGSQGRIVEQNDNRLDENRENITIDLLV